jgi:alkylation response protein AidB-like acyl-CoA dehydrogenase
MDFDLDAHEHLIQKTARDFADRELALNAAKWDREEIFPLQAMQKLNALGFLTMLVPESLGGSGAGPVGYALAVMALARGCASTAVTMMVTNMVADAIARFGTPEQQRRYLPCFSDGTFACASFSLSEPGSGSDAGAMQAQARRDGDAWVLNGTKAWVSSASHAGLFLVFAKTATEIGDKVSAFLVDAKTPGLQVGRHEEKMGLRASNTAAIALEDVRVPAAALIGGLGAGLKIAFTALDGGRIGVGAQATGIGRAALAASLTYAQDRTAFGKPIAEQQAIQWKLADMATELDAAALMVLRAARMRSRGVPCTKEAAMAKMFATEAAYRVCNQAVQIHGGYGYIGEFPVERHFRDVRVTMIYEGTNEIQRVVVARALSA